MQSLSAARDRYAREAARYDVRWRRYLRETVAETLELLSPEPGQRLLDLGCGTGLLLEAARRRWPAMTGWGVDLSPPMLAVARRRLGPRAPLVAADVHLLPMATASVDLAVSTSSLHHWTEPSRALAELSRVLRPEGRLVLTDWSDDYLALRIFSRTLRIFDRSIRRSYSSVEAARLLRSSGFVVEEVRSFRVGWLWGMMTISARKGG